MNSIGEVTEDGSTFNLYEIVVCDSLAKKLYPENFDKCGMVVPTTRSTECLGDGTVVPSQYWGYGEEGVLNFLNDDAAGKPPFFENSTDRFIVVVSLILTKFLKFNCVF